MNLAVCFRCRSCEDENASLLGTPGYQWKNPLFNVFSDAVKHLKDEPDHLMEIEIRDTTEDDY